MHYCFADCTLDTQRYELRRGSLRVPLRRKVFQVLVYLLEQRDRVVPRDEILAQVWPEQYVGEETLTSCVKGVRRAVGDTGRAQRVIQTVHGHGLRFVADVTVAETAPAPRPASPPPGPLPPARLPAALLVGRETELTALHHWYTTALQGTRQVGFITGEAGVGKTALVDAFVAQVAAEGAVWSGHGQCIEQYGAGEAYLPVLEALGRLCRGPHGPQVLAWLRQNAPSWLAQMPTVLPAAERDAFVPLAGATTQARMLRELAEALESLTQAQPLLLVFEDLHWSDASTLEWLAYVARRRDLARLLVLATVRPAEARRAAHPVETLVQDVLVRTPGATVRVGALSGPEVARYVARRFGEGPLVARLAPVLYQRTQGHALFLVTMVADWQQRGLVLQRADGWDLTAPLDATTAGVPATLRHLIEQQCARLAAAEQAVVAAASVAGVEFTAAAVAAAVGTPADEVDMQCATLARHGPFLHATGTVTWPDGTVTGRYGFGHALYQEVLYAHLPVGARTRMHQQIGTRLEQGYGAQSRDIAAELAEHFVRGREHHRAVRYGWLAAEAALARHAHHEGVTHLTRTLDALTQLPASRERALQELQVLVTLGRSLMATQGAAAPAVEQTYARAYTVCQPLEDTARLLPILAGLQRFYLVRADYPRAHALGTRLLAMAQGLQQREFVREGHTILGVVESKWGHLAAAHTHQEQARAVIEPQPQHRSGLLQDVQVANLVNSARVLWGLGRPTQALGRSQEGVRRARVLAEPTSLTFALLQSAQLQVCLRDAAAVQALAEEVLGLTQAQAFTFWEGRGRMLLGWSRLLQGDPGAGLAAMRAGLATVEAVGAQIERSVFLALLAEGYGVAADPTTGLAVLAEALGMVAATGERWWEAELYRLRGALLCSQGGLPPHTPSQASPAPAPAAPQPEACFHQALAIARQQQAKSLELRTATSLSRLWQQQGKRDEAYELLAPIYGWFTEGFDTADLQEGKALLEELGG